MTHGGHERLVNGNWLLPPAAIKDEAALVTLVFIVSQDMEDRANGQGATKIFGGGKTIEFKIIWGSSRSLF